MKPIDVGRFEREAWNYLNSDYGRGHIDEQTDGMKIHFQYFAKYMILGFLVHLRDEGWALVKLEDGGE
jgi:hypothetical protein